MIPTSENSEPFFKWLFRRSDNFDQIVFLFISRRNSTNYRNLGLFTASKSIRLVYFAGSRFKYLDRFVLKLARICFFIAKFRLKNYRYIHFFDPLFKTETTFQVLHIDDPTYSKTEIQSILSWEKRLFNASKSPIIIVTNSYTLEWLSRHTQHSSIYIIEQGFHEIEISKQFSRPFSCVYSSSYIHYGTDKHGQDTSWGCSFLIDEILPRLFYADPQIIVHLIGEIGPHANIKLAKFPNVICHGRVDPVLNMQLLSRCSLGMYVRTHDNLRSVLKIFSFIGAGLPTVTFDLIDTKVIKDFKLGEVVHNIDDYISEIINLKNSPLKLQKLQDRVLKFRPNYTWTNLALMLQSDISKNPER